MYVSFLTAPWFLKRKPWPAARVTAGRSKSARRSPKLPVFYRVRCKHLSMTCVNPPQSGSSLFPGFLAHVPCSSAAHSTLHRAWRGLSHFTLWHTFIYKQNSLHISPTWQNPTLLSKKQLRYSYVMENHPGAAPHFTPLCHWLHRLSSLNEGKPSLPWLCYQAQF